MERWNAQLRSDDSEGGALVAHGSIGGLFWRCTITTINGITKITWFNGNSHDRYEAKSQSVAENEFA